MDPYDALREQIVSNINDLTTLEDLIAAGETAFQIDRDGLESAIQIKVAILQGLETEHDNTLLEPGEDDRGMIM